MEAPHENKSAASRHRPVVHHVLARSYSFYLVLFLFGAVLDLAFPMRVFSESFSAPFGLALLIFGTGVIFWAQHTSRNLGHVKDITRKNFFKGPYRYARSPTHWGLAFLFLGFGLLINAYFIILTTFVSFIVTRAVFLRKEEALLAAKYGVPYREYQRAVSL